MRYRWLGRTGVKVSEFGFGAATLGSRWGPRWTMSEEDADVVVGLALDAGINHFDTANVYNGGESEVWLGRALKAHSARDRVVLSTKFGYRTDPRNVNSGGSGRRAMTAAVDRSLRRLGTDWIDLYYLHLWDRETPVAETLAAAQTLVAQGKIRYLGVSNVPAWYVGVAEGLHPGAVSAVQLNYNLLVRSVEHEFATLAEHTGVGLVGWGPLANGLLAGRYRVAEGERRLEGAGRLTETFGTGNVDPFAPGVGDVLEQLDKVAADTGHPRAVVALAWLLGREPLASILLGVSGPEQLAQNLRAAEVDLPEDARTALDRVSEPVLAHPYNFLTPQLQKLVHGNDLPQRQKRAADA
ncbi:aryl-alcohol dehydrogenase-like predicted oxidoreductase [Amycolatopsis sulphurea]|jgi:aryl-alcohol dehydrogenase-like predicted oxidoreductase|uniref:Aryl-alcohol dehydrogenase-like predicted oxidoreductase n=1 Tax=Amycolatopsis sulphurea TaxID=76022 RepID=A0A2A9FFY8_9PSEU|nr:aldo/keto reductase [Amycolatopsis sulphurea]PFG49686.1 aryl-alcohol dehydrogenase-like predicted oxidoreductase [Amycolatopsis sulphurea]